MVLFVYVYGIFSALTSSSCAINWLCDGKATSSADDTRTVTEVTSAWHGMTWHIEPDTLVQPGDTLQVRISKAPGQGDTYPITGFFLRAHWTLNPQKSVGAWTTMQGRKMSCLERGHVWVELDETVKEVILANWTAPDMSQWQRHEHYEQPIEFVMSLASSSQEAVHYWDQFTSPVILPAINNVGVAESGNVGKLSPGIDPFNDPHNVLKEEDINALAKKRKEEEIDDENKYSEGPWQKIEDAQRMQHQREVEKEQEDFELVQQQEQEAREARFRAEMLDKEEHDRLENENIKDHTAPIITVADKSGANVIVSTIMCFILATFTHFL